ncbi:MAG: isoprenyl transferase [Candidatus Omnitrophota bacterium]
MIDKKNNPKHIAIIMDGNGRWAQARRLPRVIGHREGINRVREIVRVAPDLGVKVLTLFAFSSENWNRPKKEVDALMRYLKDFLDNEIKDLHKNNIKVLFIGRKDPFPEDIRKKMAAAEEKTHSNSKMTLVFALNYGSRQEIVDAAKDFAHLALKGKVRIDDLDEEVFGRFLYTGNLPDPDLLIRTSGEIRISNFLLWQLSYAEFYFVKKCWPDFKKDDLREAIEAFTERKRRFGGIDAK